MANINNSKVLAKKFKKVARQRNDDRVKAGGFVKPEEFGVGGNVLQGMSMLSNLIPGVGPFISIGLNAIGGLVGGIEDKRAQDKAFAEQEDARMAAVEKSHHSFLQSNQAENPYGSIYRAPMGGMIPYENEGAPNAELEQGEVYRTPDRAIHAIPKNAKSHRQGGEDLRLPPLTQILGRVSMAPSRALAKDLGRDLWRGHRKNFNVLLNRPTWIDKTTAELNLMKVDNQFTDLFDKQERVKGMSKNALSNPSDVFCRGGRTKRRYQGGGTHTDDTPYLPMLGYGQNMWGQGEGEIAPNQGGLGRNPYLQGIGSPTSIGQGYSMPDTSSLNLGGDPTSYYSRNPNMVNDPLNAITETQLTPEQARINANMDASQQSRLNRSGVGRMGQGMGDFGKSLLGASFGLPGIAYDIARGASKREHLKAPKYFIGSSPVARMKDTINVNPYLKQNLSTMATGLGAFRRSGAINPGQYRTGMTKFSIDKMRADEQVLRYKDETETKLAQQKATMDYLVQRENVGKEFMVDRINQMTDAQGRNIIGSALGRFGQLGQVGLRDYRLSQADRQRLALLPDMISNYNYNPYEGFPFKQS